MPFSPGDDPTADELAADTLLQRLGEVIADHSRELTVLLGEVFEQQIPELPRDAIMVELLLGSSSANLENVSHLLRGHTPLAEIRLPASAAEYARRLAQRETPTSALLRAYRLGQMSVLQWANGQIDRMVDDPRLALLANQRLTEITFVYIDAMSEEVMGVYQEERERWLAHRRTVQRDLVEAILRGDQSDIAGVEKNLHYRLRQYHLGLVLWVAPTAATDGAAQQEDRGLRRLDSALNCVTSKLGVSGQPLVLPRDQNTVWAWLPLGRRSDFDWAALEGTTDSEPSVRIAVGTVGVAVEGFSTSHFEALAAHKVATAHPEQARKVTSFATPGVRAAALLVDDLRAARRLVQRSLGTLAEEGESAARLRETLLAFLEERDSYVATAARLHLHKNTVKYRVQRAEEARRKPLDQDRFDMELSLYACEWLGASVLTAPAD